MSNVKQVKIQSVNLENCKNVSSFQAFFGGKSAHVTGANGYGKSTLIKVLVDKLRGLEPSIITKIGEKAGSYEMILTDGGRFKWEFNHQGKEVLQYFPKDSLKAANRQDFKSILNQYFPNQFDINKFLTTTEPRKRLDMISQLIDVDLSDVQNRYKKLFDTRTSEKRHLKLLESQMLPKPDICFKSDVSIDAEISEVEKFKESVRDSKLAVEQERQFLNSKYLENKKANDAKQEESEYAYSLLIKKHNEEQEAKRLKIIGFNLEQEKKSELIKDLQKRNDRVIEILSGTSLQSCYNTETAEFAIDMQDKPLALRKFEVSELPKKAALNLPDPMPSDSNLTLKITELEALESKLQEKQNALYLKQEKINEIKAAQIMYEKEVKKWLEFQTKIRDQQKILDDCNHLVADVLSEIKSIVSSAKLPDEFSIDLTNRNDILFRVTPGAEYLPITNETLASSAIFIAAFKLHAFYANIFRVVHFDVSYLDFQNRKIVIEQAKKMNIQLLTEAPASTEEELQLQYHITEL